MSRSKECLSLWTGCRECTECSGQCFHPLNTKFPIQKWACPALNEPWGGQGHEKGHEKGHRSITPCCSAQQIRVPLIVSGITESSVPVSVCLCPLLGWAGAQKKPLGSAGDLISCGLADMRVRFSFWFSVPLSDDISASGGSAVAPAGIFVSPLPSPGPGNVVRSRQQVRDVCTASLVIPERFSNTKTFPRVFDTIQNALMA